MDISPLRIAFYGKGGIGKSTIAAHISSAFALLGKRVLHIGCDPKADSVRPLTSMRIPTVLDMLNSAQIPLFREQVVFPGAFGVSCIEAGGPQAGAGCAGLGIVAMAEELGRLGILAESWDVIVYDVLGDVVCGGFAVPMRKHYVDRVYLVTSSQFMSLYAANNIMKGVARYSTRLPMLGGLIHNHCYSDEDARFVSAFAERTNSKLTGALTESASIRHADRCRSTVHSIEPGGEEAKAFNKLADRILGQGACTCPTPMEDDALESFYIQAMETEGKNFA
jgi:nitrogenase iron protein NifH